MFTSVLGGFREQNPRAGAGRGANRRDDRFIVASLRSFAPAHKAVRRWLIRFDRSALRPRKPHRGHPKRINSMMLRHACNSGKLVQRGENRGV